MWQHRDSHSVKVWQKFEALPKDGGPRSRCLKEDENNIFVFAKGSSQRGYRYSVSQFDELYTVIYKDEGEEWKKRVKKIIKRLEASGLWPEELDFFKKLERISWEDRQQMLQISKSRYTSSDGRLCQKTSEEMTELWRPLYEKYPFAFFTDIDTGNTSIMSEYVYEKSDAKVKTMYFGASNAKIKQDFKDAMAHKQNFSTGIIRTNYDVSLDYDSEKNRAWYREEYKNCGNGHYYIAIDHNTALFIEND